MCSVIFSLMPKPIDSCLGMPTCMFSQPKSAKLPISFQFILSISQAWPLMCILSWMISSAVECLTFLGYCWGGSGLGFWKMDLTSLGLAAMIIGFGLFSGQWSAAGGLKMLRCSGGGLLAPTGSLAAVKEKGLEGDLMDLRNGLTGLPVSILTNQLIKIVTCIEVRCPRRLLFNLFLKSILSMSGTRNWNDMSSSEDEDSWFDDEQPPQKNTEDPEPTKPEGSPEPVASVKPEPSPKAVEEKQKPAREGGERKHTFLKDEDLLVQFSNKTVDDPRVIKAVKVSNQEHKKLLNSLKNARVKEIREGVFILHFHQPQGVLQFIREKIANRYRFFLQPYFKSKREGQEQAQKEERRQHYQKKERRPRNQEQREQGKRMREDRRQPRREKEEKKVYVQKECFEIENNKNILHIKSQAFDIGKIVAELEDKKVFKNFSKLYIKTPPALLDKVMKLVAEIAFKHKFNLDKEPQPNSSEEILDLVLIQGLKPAKPVQRQEKKEQTRPVRKEKQQPRATKEREVVASKQQKYGRRLAANFQEYFSHLSTNNLSEIVKGFDQNQYVKGLKENNSTIFDKNWKSWKIEAEEQYIEQLLKLVHRLKKSTIYDIDLKPSKRNERAVLTAELRARPEKERRPKVDASGVNGYLS